MKDRIREIRKAKGLNQTEFGAKIGLSQRGVANIETGSNVTERNFNAICKAFNVNPEWLRNGVGEMFLSVPGDRDAILQSVVKEFGLNPDSALLVKTFLELPEEHRAGVVEFAKTFASAMAAQMGVELTTREEMPVHPTTAQKREIVNRQLAEEEEAAKRGTASSASISMLGSRKILVTALESQNVII